MEKKIALFGGSLNPVQNAHRKIASFTLKNQLADEIWIIPSKHHAFKGEIQSISDKHRLEMLKLAFIGLKHKVLDIELKQNKTSYTVDTLKSLKSEYQTYHFLFILGYDNLKELNLWKSYKEIFDYAHLLCFSRHLENSIPSYLNHLSSKIHLIHNFNSNVSSTEIRNKIRDKMNFQNLLYPSVFDYIKKHHLYE